MKQRHVLGKSSSFSSPPSPFASEMKDKAVHNCQAVNNVFSEQ